MKYVMDSGDEVLIDKEDLDLVKRYKWRVTARKTVKYAVAYNTGAGRKGVPHQIYLHRLVMGSPAGKQIDHINGNGLDCQKSNLRACTAHENRRNQSVRKGGTSKFKGVNFHHGKRRAYLVFNHKQKHLGMFDTEIQAAAQYDLHAKSYYGAFANLNFPESI